MSGSESLSVSRLRHDLRTYVNHLQGYGEMILETAQDDGPAALEEPMTRLLDQGKTLLDVIARHLPTTLADLSTAVLEALIADLRAPVAESQEILVELAKIAEAEHADEAKSDLEKIRRAVDDLERFVGSSQMREPSSPKETPTECQSSPEGGACILVVDDVAGNRELLRRRLQREGHQAVMAANGREALDRINAGGLDLVLLDILMPEMNGFQVLETVKSTSSGRDLPIIMISSLDEIDSVVRCIEMGAEDFLPKPFDPVLLRARVNACLQKKRHRDQELEYLHNVSLVTAAAAAVESGGFDEHMLDAVSGRQDALGQLARVFQRMGKEVQAREHRLKTQVQQLRIEIDEARKQKQVEEVTESDYFQSLQKRASDLRQRANRAK